MDLHTVYIFNLFVFIRGLMNGEHVLSLLHFLKLTIRASAKYYETNGSHLKTWNIYLMLSTRQSRLTKHIYCRNNALLRFLLHNVPEQCMKGTSKQDILFFSWPLTVSPSNCKPMTEVPFIRTDKVDKYMSLFLWGTHHMIVALLSAIALTHGRWKQC